MPYFRIVVAFWVIFWIYWMASARNVKSEAQRQSFSSQILFSGGFVLAAGLLFSAHISASWLTRQLLPPGLVVGSVGCLLAGLGLSVAIAARRALGANWSGVVALKEDHELIMAGPYRFVRHPIYSGMILLVLGTAIAIGQTRGLLALLAALVSVMLRVRAEEALMEQTFPDTFPAYKQRTKRLIPWLY